MELGTYLKELREQHMVEKKASLQDVATTLDISVGGLHGIESGAIKSPSLNTLIKLANLYGVELSEVVAHIDIKKEG